MNKLTKKLVISALIVTVLALTIILACGIFTANKKVYLNAQVYQCYLCVHNMNNFTVYNVVCTVYASQIFQIGNLSAYGYYSTYYGTPMNVVINASAYGYLSP